MKRQYIIPQTACQPSSDYSRSYSHTTPCWWFQVEDEMSCQSRWRPTKRLWCWRGRCSPQQSICQGITTVNRRVMNTSITRYRNSERLVTPPWTPTHLGIAPMLHSPPPAVVASTKIVLPLQISSYMYAHSGYQHHHLYFSMEQFLAGVEASRPQIQLEALCCVLCCQV